MKAIHLIALFLLSATAAARPNSLATIPLGQHKACGEYEILGDYARPVVQLTIFARFPGPQGPIQQQSFDIDTPTARALNGESNHGPCACIIYNYWKERPYRAMSNYWEYHYGAVSSPFVCASKRR